MRELYEEEQEGRISCTLTPSHSINPPHCHAAASRTMQLAQELCDEGHTSYIYTLPPFLPPPLPYIPCAAASRTMQLAQELYEEGHISYMRTDGVSLAEGAVAELRAYLQVRACA